MKENKFRAWDKKYKRMMYKDFYDRNWYTEPDGGKCIKSLHPEDVHDQDLMQYTGLKDKNGVEIYEGDISKNNRDFLYVITWHPSMCAFVQLQWGHTFSDVDFLDMRFNFHEIIGNIYENPELREREV